MICYESGAASPAALDSGVSEEVQFRLLFEQAPVAMHEIDASGVLTRVNQMECDLLGWHRDQIIGRPVWDLVDPSERDTSRRVVLAKLACSDPVPPFRRSYRNSQGARLHFEVHESKVFNTAGVLQGIRSVLIDVTAKELLQLQLSESEERFRNVVERLGEGICIVDTQERVTFANSAADQIFGVASGQLLGRNLNEFVDETQWASVERQAKLRLEGLTSTYELEIVRPSGETLTLLVTGSPETNAAGARVGTYGIIHDITERKLAEQKLANSEQRFRSLASSMGDALVVTDAEGCITFWNLAAEHIFGYAPNEALDFNFVDLIVPRRYRQEYRNRFRRYESFGEEPLEGETAELIVRHKSGRPVVIELSHSQFHSSDSWHGLACIRDITRRKADQRKLARTARHLEEARARAEDASRAKSDFLASMSHEIRTPMNGVVGMTGLLLDTDLSEDQRFFAESVRRSADSLLDLINEILDFSKIEARQVELESISFDLRTALEDTLDLIAPTAAEKGLEVALWIDQLCPRHVTGDPGRVRQIVLNLLGNAVKFTHAGHVALWVSAEAISPIRTRLRIEVRDTGIGVDPTKLPDLFERFTQGDTSTTRRYGGTGLGLAITKQLVELMGGTVEAESQLGKGSTFRLRIPLDTAEQQPPRAPMMDVAGRRALVVDDNAIGRFTTRELCLQRGMHVVEAVSAQQALELLSQAAAAGLPFEIVLTDFMMPEMDGEALLSAIRSSPQFNQIPAVLLTSVGLGSHLDQLNSLGCDAYLVKPVKASVLEAAVSRALSGRPLGLPSRTVASGSLAESGDRHATGDCGKIRARVLLVEDHHINQKLGVRLLEKLGCSVDVASDGVEAVAISAEVPYDAIFMDCQMPEMDGYEATRQIRAREGAARHTPIIAMTACAMSHDRQLCREAGMDEFISKPVSPNTIRDSLLRLLTRPRIA